MKVSVAVITYNASKYIEPVLESILTQKCNFEYEIVIGDDCSKDNTLEILYRFQSKYGDILKILPHEYNVGASRNYLDVLKACSGEYIAHLDGDDLMYPNKLQIQVDYLDKNNRCSACFHNMDVFDDLSGKKLRLYNPEKDRKSLNLNDVVKYGAGMNHSSKMFRRSTIEDISLELPMKIVFDWYMHIVHARHGTLDYINQVLGAYRISSNSVVHSNEKKIEEVRNDFLLTIDLASKFNPSIDSILYARSRINYERSIRALEQNRYKLFELFIAESAKDKIYVSLLHKVIYFLRCFPAILHFSKKILLK